MSSYTRVDWKNSAATPLNAENLNKMDKGIYDAHHLVERVVGDVWTYEKWSDGTSKCWGKLTSKHTTSSGATIMPGDSFYVKKKLEFPKDLFISVPVVLCSAIDSGTGSATASTDSTTTKDLCVVNVWGNEAALDEANVLAMGIWKV